MTPQLARAIVLIEQNRYEQAIGELQLHLAEHAEDAQALAWQAYCLSRLERYDEAQQQAQHAIHLAPDESFGYRVLAEILADRNRFRDAELAINQALQMDPQDPDLFGIKAVVLASLRQWKEAVEAADTGLQFDPDHLVCLNARARALTMLGDRAGAAATVQDALRKNPDDPLLHANQGWASLHANEPTKAAEHFREALRLEPEMDFARAGIIEALKARNFLYRWMLQYFLWMSRLSDGVRWGIVIGLYFLQKFLAGLGRQNPALAPYLFPLLCLYIGFAVLTWLSYPLFNLMLRLDRFGRHALSAEQRAGANLLGVTLLIAIVFFVAFWATSNAILSDIFLHGALVFALLSLPVSAIYICDAGWPRRTMFGCTGLLLLLGFVWMLPDQWSLPMNGVDVLAGARQAAAFFPIGIVASQFLANALAGVRVKK